MKRLLPIMLRLQLVHLATWTYVTRIGGMSVTEWTHTQWHSKVCTCTVILLVGQYQVKPFPIAVSFQLFLNDMEPLRFFLTSEHLTWKSSHMIWMWFLLGNFQQEVIVHILHAWLNTQTHTHAHTCTHTHTHTVYHHKILPLQPCIHLSYLHVWFYTSQILCLIYPYIPTWYMNTFNIIYILEIEDMNINIMYYIAMWYNIFMYF